MLQSGELALIERLVAEMTLEEKLGQLTMVSAELIQTGPTSVPVTPKAIREGRIGSLLNLWGAERVREVQRFAVEESRLKIPLFFGLDVVHGHKTIFPIPLGETCAFDPELWERTARAAAEETAADGVDLTFAPMLDVARDPRWGRTAEGPGEDTFLASRFAEAKVRGFQSPHLGDASAIAATAKHLAALRSRDGGPGICFGRHLRTAVARGLSAALPCGRGGWRRGDHARLHGSRRHADDGQCGHTA